jgi:hypothetical protein
MNFVDLSSKSLITAGLLRAVPSQDGHRMTRSYVEAGNAPVEDGIVQELPEGISEGTGLGISDDPADNLYRRR